MILVLETIDGEVDYVNLNNVAVVHAYPTEQRVVFSYSFSPDGDGYRAFVVDEELGNITQETYNYIINRLNRWAGV